MKKSKIFPAVLYFIFTFLVGFVLALVLTPIYLYSGILLDELSDDLYAGKYDEAIRLVGGYYNSNVLYTEDVGKSGKIIIYETATIGYEEQSSGDGSGEQTTSKKTVLQKSYVAFLFGVQDEYKTYAEENNQTKVILKVNGADETYELLDTDYTGDGTKDGILTYEKKGIAILELVQKTYSSVEGLTFIDKDGQTFYTKTFDEALNYSTGFYNDVDAVITAYNDKSTASETLKQLDEAFLSNESYKKSSYDIAEQRAQKQATKTIIIYFVVVYVIADFLFTRFIVKFVKFMLFKVFKIKRKERPVKINNESFGNDYFCAVTLKVTLQENLDFDQNITVSYGEGEKALSFELTKADGYEKYLRVKAGIYNDLNVVIPDGYKLEGLPESLVADGYKKTINATLVSIED